MSANKREGVNGGGGGGGAGVGKRSVRFNNEVGNNLSNLVLYRCAENGTARKAVAGLCATRCISATASPPRSMGRHARRATRRLHTCEGVRIAQEMLREADQKLLAAARVVYSTGLYNELMQLVGVC